MAARRLTGVFGAGGGRGMDGGVEGTLGAPAREIVTKAGGGGASARVTAVDGASAAGGTGAGAGACAGAGVAAGETGSGGVGKLAEGGVEAWTGGTLEAYRSRRGRPPAHARLMLT